MRSTRGATALVAAAAALALTACGGSAATEAPAALPSAPASPAPSPTPTPSTPAPSPSPSGTQEGTFDEATQESAEQFVREWYGALSRALSGEPDDVAALGDFYLERCSTCRTYHSEAEALSDRRQSVQGGEQAVISVTYDTDSGSAVVVDAVVQSRPGTLLDASGEEVQQFEGGVPIRFVVNLVPRGTGWAIQDILSLGAA